MTFSAAFVYQKLETIRDHTAELEKLLGETTDREFLTDSQKRLVAERLVQLIVDGMIDINQHFIRELNLELSDDLRGTFIIMGESGILPKSFAEKISPVTGVRNILVHQYEKLDKKLFVRNLRLHFDDFVKYQRFIAQYLDRRETVKKS